jgi:hypothetical protein
MFDRSMNTSKKHKTYGVIQYVNWKSPSKYCGRTIRPEKKLLRPMNTLASIWAVAELFIEHIKA